MCQAAVLLRSRLLGNRGYCAKSTWHSHWEKPDRLQRRSGFVYSCWGSFTGELVLRRGG